MSLMHLKFIGIIGLALMLTACGSRPDDAVSTRSPDRSQGASQQALAKEADVANTHSDVFGDFPHPKIDLDQSGVKEAQAIFAGGCFWCTEAVFEQLAGVSDVYSGYAGGSKETANYKRVCEGDTGHAEVIRITYDPSKISYGQLMRVFFATHDPTQLNRQGNDVGTQYRSAIFYQSEEEKKVAQAYIKQLEEAGLFRSRIVTTLEPLKEFFPAERYHQDYARNNPLQPYIQFHALPNAAKVEQMFPELKQ